LYQAYTGFPTLKTVNKTEGLEDDDKSEEELQHVIRDLGMLTNVKTGRAKHVE